MTSLISSMRTPTANTAKQNRAFGNLDVRYLVAAFCAVALFWCLDGYYLRQERLFRSLYDYVRTSETGGTDYSMDTRPYASQARNKWHCCMRSVVC